MKLNQPDAPARRPPQASDAVTLWLPPRLAGRLASAGLLTLAQLMARVHGGGRHWHAGIKAIGAGKARYLVAWLHTHLHTQMHVSLHPPRRGGQLDLHRAQALQSGQPPGMAMHPLERLVVPQALDGSQGLNRRPQAQCMLAAGNDHQAILDWLQARCGHGQQPPAGRLAPQGERESTAGPGGVPRLSNTRRAYRKEAERFLLWAVIHRGKALSSMDDGDCRAYLAFLADPQPRSHWCGARGHARRSPQWRPFEGPLSVSAQRHATTVLKNLHGFLVDQHYLTVNPWSAVGVPRGRASKLDAGRSFSPAQWAFIVQQLAALPMTAASRRLRLGLQLLYATGLRLSELVVATAGDLQWVGDPAAAAAAADGVPMQGWLLRVVGQGQTLRTLPLPAAVMAALVADLVARGLDADPAHSGNRGAFLLGQASDAAQRAPGLHGGRVVDPRQGIAATTFYDQTKAFFAACANVLRGQGDVAGAERVARASTHWMRHSHARHAMAGGMPVALAQRQLGHASPATTAAYLGSGKRPPPEGGGGRGSGGAVC